MPELPEVETIARQLRLRIIGKQIAEVYLSGKKLRRPIPNDFAGLLKGKTVRLIHRRGKYLIVELTPRAFWVIHLGMTGRLAYAPGTMDREAHTHVSIRFMDGSELHYCDPRRFGFMDFHPMDDLKALPDVRRLGMDPLGPKFTAAWLLAKLMKSHCALKAFLLDQSKIAGLGNIYVCEAMFHARLHPARRCHTLSIHDATALVHAIREVLCFAIRNHGTSFSDFMDSDGAFGNHQEFLQVFQKEGEKCRKCNAAIVRMKQGTRGTYFCPRCQKDKNGNQGKKR